MPKQRIFSVLPNEDSSSKSLEWIRANSLIIDNDAWNTTGLAHIPLIFGPLFSYKIVWLGYRSLAFFVHIFPRCHLTPVFIWFIHLCLANLTGSLSPTLEISSFAVPRNCKSNFIMLKFSMSAVSLKVFLLEARIRINPKTQYYLRSWVKIPCTSQYCLYAAV